MRRWNTCASRAGRRAGAVVGVLVVTLGVAPPGVAPAGEAAARAPHVRDITLQVDPDRKSLGAFTGTWGDNLVFDKNGDGDPDVLLSYHFFAPWELWLGNGEGGFIPDQMLRRKDRHECEAADFAGPDGPPDGLIDLYCVRGANRGTRNDKSNELLEQQPDGSFKNVVRAWGARDPSGRGRAVAVLHIRGDGVPSLFVGNKRAQDYPSPDRIYENVGDHFVERSVGGLPSEQDSHCASTGDFDGDGRQDLLSCSRSLRLYRDLTTPDGPVVYREVAARQGLPSGRMLDAQLVELNRDGRRDLVTLTGTRLEVRLNTGRPHHFPTVDFALPLKAGVSFCSGHADGDRSNDLLVVRGLPSWDADLQRPDTILVNTGTGEDFEAVRVPQPPSQAGHNGNGDTCSAIPHFQGRRAAWTINNGKAIYHPAAIEHPGYRQLVILDP